MTPSQLKALHLAQCPESHFFSRDSMKYFGDTMANFRVRVVTVETVNKDSVVCWELSRHRPVKNGLFSSHFFSFDGSVKYNVRRVLDNPTAVRL